MNQHLSEVIVAGAIMPIDLLVAASDFMTFDTTIVSVVIPELNFSFVAEATTDVRDFRYALLLANSLIDGADLQSFFTDSIGAPWMYTGGLSTKLSGAAGSVDMNLVFQNGGPIIAKSKRRFRENDSTVFLVVDSRLDAGDTVPLVTGFTRTLIHIP